MGLKNFFNKEGLCRVKDFSCNQVSDIKNSFKNFKTWKDTPSMALKPVLLIVVVLFCVMLGAAVFSTGSSNNASDEPIYFRVQEGMSASEIGKELEAKGVIDSKLKFWFIAKLNNSDSKFKVGSYVLHRGMAQRDVLQKLVDGDTTIVRFTVPEGFQVRDIAAKLDRDGIANEKKFIALASKYAPYSYMKSENNVEIVSEGFLFPDTYEIDTTGDEETVLKMMTQDFDNRLTEEMRQRAKEMNLSIHELITLASIVEVEAGSDKDRPIIAQVFLKRMEIGMPLQSCATILYAMHKRKEDLSIEDTKLDSPYNTYLNPGLPPGPISNPGLASIQAVLHPADTDYLYFVADHDGNTYYSSSYSEHLDLVNQLR